jgi:hypothetical protein
VEFPPAPPQSNPDGVGLGVTSAADSAAKNLLSVEHLVAATASPTRQAMYEVRRKQEETPQSGFDARTLNISTFPPPTLS